MKREAVSVIFLLCSLAFCCQPSRAGVTFLSPAHKPLDKGKPPRVNRQAMELTPPLKDSDLTVVAPFEMGITLHEEEFEEYGQALRKLLQHILGDTDTTV